MPVTTAVANPLTTTIMARLTPLVALIDARIARAEAAWRRACWQERIGGLVDARGAVDQNARLIDDLRRERAEIQAALAAADEIAQPAQTREAALAELIARFETVQRVRLEGA